MMTSVTSLEHLFPCTQCGEPFVAPERSELVGADEVHSLWICARCGSVRETTFKLHTAAAERSPSILRHAPQAFRS
jgi:hypothetical protein